MRRNMSTSRISPVAYRRKNAQRSAEFIGTRSVRAATSAAFGAGIRDSIHVKNRNGAANRRPAVTGIQDSDTPADTSHDPTDFVAPSATMKLVHSPAAKASVCRRPSRNPSTIPNTIPSDKPLQKNQTALTGGGVTANRNRDNSAAPTNPIKNATRRCGGTSATTRMPRNFDVVYPAAWAMTNTVLSPITS
jgi:hypothetical protein